MLEYQIKSNDLLKITLMMNMPSFATSLQLFWMPLSLAVWWHSGTQESATHFHNGLHRANVSARECLVASLEPCSLFPRVCIVWFRELWSICVTMRINRIAVAVRRAPNCRVDRPLATPAEPIAPSILYSGRPRKHMSNRWHISGASSDFAGVSCNRWYVKRTILSRRFFRACSILR